MIWMKRVGGIAVAALVLAACEESRVPTGPAEVPPLAAISDGAHSLGTMGFFFLPPLVPDPGATGVFDPALEPVVEIVELASGAVLATFTTADGPGSTTVRVVPDDEHYIVNWDTRSVDFDLDPDLIYRIRVVVNGVELGYADVDVVTSGRELKNVDTGEFIALLDGRTLPIKFRIEEGIVAHVGLEPEEATIFSGATQQFLATVTDLHGNPLALSPAWASSDEAVATVDEDGLATGVGAGTAVITASVRGVSAEGALTVLPQAAPSWHALGSGIDGLGVLAFAEYEGDLIVGSRFSGAGGQPARNIARWDGAAWGPLGDGLDGTAHALAVHDGDLVAAGDLWVQRWDGAAWSLVGAGLDVNVRALAVYAGELIAAGARSTTDVDEAWRAARWDGSAWHPIGAGLPGPVTALVVHEGELIAAVPSPSRVMRWDGSAWHSMSHGLEAGLRALTVHGDDLVAAGGRFSPSGIPQGFIQWWSGSAWEGTGPILGIVRVLGVHGEDLVAGGTMASIDGTSVPRIARWDGAAWHPLGTGTNGAVDALTVFRGDLIAGGLFTEADGKPASRIARWGLPD